MGAISVLNGSSYVLTLFAWTQHPGSRIAARIGNTVNSTVVETALSLSTKWTKLHVVVPAAPQSVPTGTLLFLRTHGRTPGHRAAVVWIDDVTVTVNATVEGTTRPLKRHNA